MQRGRSDRSSDSHVRSSKRSPRSVARLVACVRGFYRYLHLRQHINENPAIDLQAPRAWKVLPKFLSLEEVNRLLSAPDTGTARGLRDRALIELLYATGLRVSELIALRPQDLHLEGGRVDPAVPEGESAAAAREANVAAAVRQRPRWRPRHHARWLLEDPQGIRQDAWDRAAAQSARAPPFLRDAPVGARRRPARHPDDAGARGSFDHADLHTHPRRSNARPLRSIPSARMKKSATAATRTKRGGAA
jgi:integrase/recombinase XerD